MSEVAPPPCPVCRARYRGGSTCSRCGAELSGLLAVWVAAFRLRAEARTALDRGEVGKARGLVARAEALCSTPPGRKLGAILAFAG